MAHFAFSTPQKEARELRTLDLHCVRFAEDLSPATGFCIQSGEPG